MPETADPAALFAAGRRREARVAFHLRSRLRRGSDAVGSALDLERAGRWRAALEAWRRLEGDADPRVAGPAKTAVRRLELAATMLRPRG